MSEIERSSGGAENRESWPAPSAQPHSPLPRLDDLPLAENGYDAEGVRAAFDSFYRHIAQMDSTLRAIEAVEVFRSQASELRRELRALKAAGWAPQPLRSSYQARGGRAAGPGMPDALPRIALEAGFLIVVAVLLAVAHFDKLEIVLIMALAWAIVGVVEWAASQERLGFRRPARAAAEPTPAAPPRRAALEPGEPAESAGWAAYSEPPEPTTDVAEAMTLVGQLPVDEEERPAEPVAAAPQAAEASEPPEGSHDVPQPAAEQAPAEPPAEPEPVVAEQAPAEPRAEPEPVVAEQAPAEPRAEPEPVVAEEAPAEPPAEPEPVAVAPAAEPEPDVEIVPEPEVEIDPEPSGHTWSWGQDFGRPEAPPPAPAERRRWLPWRRRKDLLETPPVPRPRGHVRVLPPEPASESVVFGRGDIDRILDPWEQDFDISVAEPDEPSEAEAGDGQPAPAGRERNAG